MRKAKTQNILLISFLDVSKCLEGEGAGLHTTAAPSSWHAAAQARPTGPAPATYLRRTENVDVKNKNKNKKTKKNVHGGPGLHASSHGAMET